MLAKRGVGLVTALIGTVAAPIVASVTEPLVGAVTSKITSKIQGLVGGAEGSAAGSRGDRNAALAAAVQAMNGAKAIVAETEQFKGQLLGDMEYQTLLVLILKMWNAFVVAAQNFKAAAGLAGLGNIRGYGDLSPGIISTIAAGLAGIGRTEAEKAAARAAGVALATRGTRAQLNIALTNISSGRKLIQIPSVLEEVSVPATDPAGEGAQAAQKQAVARGAEEKKGIASLLPWAALAFAILK